MNILHLKYVVCIAENGSINKAAEELHVAQPNLSRVVREMENELGIQFFRRSSRGMMLTPDGELFAGWTLSLSWNRYGVPEGRRCQDCSLPFRGGTILH